MSDKQQTLYYLIGLPGSGKSTYAHKYAQDNPNVKVISSDSIRAEMYGSEDVQDEPHKVFENLFKKAKEYFAQGFDVMVDATNISRKKRMQALKQFPKVRKVAHYIATPIARCIINDAKRERTVGTDVIHRMYEHMQIPVAFEGWDEIKIINPIKTFFASQHVKEELNDLIETNSYKQKIMYILAEKFKAFEDIYNLPQDSKYHSLSVSRHTYYVYEFLQENYYGEDRLAMLWAGLLHDTGKYHTKKFKPGARYANFIAHENVSAQISCSLLYLLGFDEEFILKVMGICQLHMDLLGIEDDEQAKLRKRELWGESLYSKMVQFHTADTSAK